jgi:hypothetical protein
MYKKEKYGFDEKIKDRKMVSGAVFMSETKRLSYL